MINNSETVKNETIDKISRRIKEYVEEFDILSNKEGFTIDIIEQIWGNLEEDADQIFKELNEEIIKQYNEKEIIKVKKKSMRKKG